MRLAALNVSSDSIAEYQTDHARAPRKLVSEEGVAVHRLPDDVVQAMGAAGQQVIGELREEDDELIRRIAESCVAYRGPIGGSMTFADAGQMNARAAALGC